MNPRQVIQLLGNEMHSKTMTFSLQQEKVQKIKLKCQNLYLSHYVPSLKLIKVLGHLIVQLVLDYSVSPRLFSSSSIVQLVLDYSVRPRLFSSSSIVQLVLDYSVRPRLFS